MVNAHALLRAARNWPKAAHAGFIVLLGVLLAVHANGVPGGAVQERALVQRRQAGVDTALTCALLPGAVDASLARDASPSLVEVMGWHRQ